MKNNTFLSKYTGGKNKKAHPFYETAMMLAGSAVLTAVLTVLGAVGTCPCNIFRTSHC
jgi:hypothetical protein